MRPDRKRLAIGANCGIASNVAMVWGRISAIIRQHGRI
jgi:hypothetical protein